SARWSGHQGGNVDSKHRKPRAQLARPQTTETSVLEPAVAQVDRRTFLARAVTGATAAAGFGQGASAQEFAGHPWERVYGAGFTGYGQPSRFEQPVQRHIFRPYGDLAPGSGAAHAPIEHLEGVITPSSLHNIRSHSGTPD